RVTESLQASKLGAVIGRQTVRTESRRIQEAFSTAKPGNPTVGSIKQSIKTIMDDPAAFQAISFVLTAMEDGPGATKEGSEANRSQQPVDSSITRGPFTIQQLRRAYSATKGRSESAWKSLNMNRSPAGSTGTNPTSATKDSVASSPCEQATNSSGSLKDLAD